VASNKSNIQNEYPISNKEHPTDEVKTKYNFTMRGLKEMKSKPGSAGRLTGFNE